MLEIVTRVVGGGRAEDDSVECKAQWPTDADKAARRIAAISNTARGDEAMWLVGLDENGHRVEPLDQTDPANWWSAVESKFADGIAPGIRIMNVPTEHGLVVCLHYETDRAPYVVNLNPNKFGGLTREVPWRDGTRTRTAKRHELLSMMSAATAAPELEVLKCGLTFRQGATQFNIRDGSVLSDVGDKRVLYLNMDLFVDSESRVLLPRHRWSVQFSTGGSARFPASKLSFQRFKDGFATTVRGEVAYGIDVRDAGILVTGPDMLKLRAYAVIPADVTTSSLDSEINMEVHIELPTNGTGRTAKARQKLHWSSGHQQDRRGGQIFATWTMPTP